MTETSESVSWLTQEAYDRLKAELDELIAYRPVMAAEINARREEGDLRENGGYHAACEEQGKTEARIRQLEEMLRRAEVGETPPNDGVVEPGMVVTVRLLDFDEEEKFLLGARENLAEAMASEVPVISGRSGGIPELITDGAVKLLVGVTIVW